MTTFIITAIILWVLFAIFKSLVKKFGGFNVFGFTTICLAFILVAVSEDEVAVSNSEVAVSNSEEKVLQHCHNTLQTGKTFCSMAFRDNNYRIWKRRAELKAKDEAARKQKAENPRKQQQRSTPKYAEYPARTSDDFKDCMAGLKIAFDGDGFWSGSDSYKKRKKTCDRIHYPNTREAQE